MSTREHFIDVGLKLVQEKGYEATGLQEILAKAGLPKGSFYHHFGSKEEFGREVIARFAAQEAARCERALSESKRPHLARLRRYFKELSQVFGPGGMINGCLFGRLSLDGATQSDLLRSQLVLGFTGWQKAIEQTLRAAKDAGELTTERSLPSLAAFLVNGWEGALLRSHTDQDDSALRNFQQIVFDLLLV
jgi:TetR/AcrR family transcriptional regulator, transcriptional repressor for nem operon